MTCSTLIPKCSRSRVPFVRSRNGSMCCDAGSLSFTAPESTSCRTAAPVNIFVVLPQNSVPDRSVISLHVEPTITVGEVKNMIHVNEGLDPEDLALQRAGGGVLDDSATLEDSHVGHETTLTAVYT